MGDFSNCGQSCLLRRFVVLLVLAVFAGCGGSDRAWVSGTLLHHDGTPLVGARVIARSNETGKSAYGQTDGNGYFELGVSDEGDGVPPGNYYVVIVEDLGGEHDRRPATIAAKYRKPESSGLTLSVEAGQSAVLDAKLDRP